MTFLGLDVSTNTTGYSLINEDGELLDIGFIDTSKEGSWIDKAFLFRQFINDYEHKVDHVGIEEILSKFSGGASSAKTIITLARFNGLATFFCKEKFGCMPIHINVIRARNLAGCMMPRKSCIKSKEFVLKRINEKYPSISWPMMKRKDSIAKQSYDMADSLVIAIALNEIVKNERTL